MRADGVQYADLVGVAVKFGIEHELDVFCDGPVHIETDAVE